MCVLNLSCVCHIDVIYYIRVTVHIYYMHVQYIYICFFEINVRYMI